MPGMPVFYPHPPNIQALWSSPTLSCLLLSGAICRTCTPSQPSSFGMLYSPVNSYSTPAFCVLYYYQICTQIVKSLSDSARTFMKILAPFPTFDFSPHQRLSSWDLSSLLGLFSCVGGAHPPVLGKGAGK